ncbi:MAG: hypothetical protein ACREHD_10670, partial [Pirellulales bacterium]
MPSISSCPACHRDLTIPDLDPLQQSLRCPLCDAGFPAEQVLADCVPFPPAAIIVEAGSSWVESSGVAAELPPNSMADQPAVAAGEVAAPSAALSPAADTSEEIKDTSPRAGEASSSNAIDHPSSVTDDAAREGAKGASADYEAFGHQVAAMRVAPRARRQASALGMLGQLLGMALGGVLGLAIGYYVLVWIGGAQADFLELRGKLPRWLVPPARRHQVPGGAVPLANQTDPDQPTNALAGLLDPFETRAAVVAPPEPVRDDGAVLHPDRFPVNADQVAIAPDRVERELADRFGALPKPLAAGYRGPRGFKLRTAAELAAAMEETDFALRCPHCQMPGAVRLA